MLVSILTLNISPSPNDGGDYGEEDDDDNDYSRVGSATHFFDGLHLRRSFLLRFLCPSTPSLHPSLFFDRNTIQIPIHPFDVLLTLVQ